MNSPGAQSAISDEFLRFAQEAIQNQQSGEGRLRSAISRAYYAVLLTVRDQLFGPDAAQLTKSRRKKLQHQVKGKSGSKTGLGSHDFIISAITLIRPSGTLSPVTLSQKVRLLKNARVHADYDFTSVNLNAIPQLSWRDYAKDNVELATIRIATFNAI